MHPTEINRIEKLVDELLCQIVSSIDLTDEIPLVQFNRKLLIDTIIKEINNARIDELHRQIYMLKDWFDQEKDSNPALHNDQTQGAVLDTLDVSIIMLTDRINQLEEN